MFGIIVLFNEFFEVKSNRDSRKTMFAGSYFLSQLRTAVIGWALVLHPVLAPDPGPQF